MKKIRCFFLVAAVCFLLCSCETLPSMSEILAYQTGPVTFEAVIRDGGELRANVHLEDGAVRLTICEHALTEGITFSEGEDGGLVMSYDDVSFSLPAGKLVKASAWMSLFRLQAETLWKIERDTMGGIAVFVCTESDTGTVLYLDAATFLPLKITSGETAIDILSAEK